MNNRFRVACYRDGKCVTVRHFTDREKSRQFAISEARSCAPTTLYDLKTGARREF